MNFKEIRQSMELINQVESAPEHIQKLIFEGLKSHFKGETITIAKVSKPFKIYKEKQSTIDLKRQIFEYIKSNPSATCDQMASYFTISKHVIVKHTSNLKKEKKIYEARVGNNRCLYVGKGKTRVKKIFRSVYVRMDKIEKFLQENGGKTIKQLAVETEYSPSEVHTAVMKLLKTAPHIKKSNDWPAVFYYDEQRKLFG